MSSDETNQIRRRSDGSIDYGYYAARASSARNGEVKRLARGVLEAPVSHRPLLSVLVTVVLLAIVL